MLVVLLQGSQQACEQEGEEGWRWGYNADIGQESNETIVGGETCAPTSMKLSNKIIMKKRSDRSKPISLLLPLNTLDDYGQCLLFQPWRTAAELIIESTEEGKVKQKPNQLPLFQIRIFS